MKDRNAFDFEIPKLLGSFEPKISGHVDFTYDNRDRLTREAWSTDAGDQGQYWTPKTLNHSYLDPSSNADAADDLTVLRNTILGVDVSKDQLGTKGSGSTLEQFTFDSDGNLDSLGTDNRGFGAMDLHYDFADELVSRGYHDYSANTDTTMWYGYNGEGLRTSKIADDPATYSCNYIWDGDELLAETNGSQITALNIWGPTGVVGRVANIGNGSNLIGYVFDPNGSRVQRTESTYFTAGDPAISNELYDAYGKLMYWSDGTYDTGSSTGGDLALQITDDPFAYKGQAGYYSDAEGQYLKADPALNPTDDSGKKTLSGLIYCQHRYYSPDLARWITRDPIGLEGGLNVYEYCGDNPVMGIDPSGLQSKQMQSPEQIWESEVIRAIKAIAAEGWKRTATDLLQMMRDGKILLDPNEKNWAETDDFNPPLGRGVMHLNPEMFQAIIDKKKVPDGLYANRVWLQSVLVHEWVHTRQDLLGRVYLWKTAENEAWGDQYYYLTQAFWEDFLNDKLTGFEKQDFNEAADGWASYGGPPIEITSYNGGRHP